MSLAPARCAAGGAGLLRGTVESCLLRNHGLLHAGEDDLALGQTQAEGRVAQRLPRQSGHLRHDLRSIPWLDNQLQAELHAHASVSDLTIWSCRSRRLMARRSQRLTAAQYWSVRRSS